MSTGEPQVVFKDRDDAPNASKRSKPADIRLYPNITDAQRKMPASYGALIWAVNRGAGVAMDAAAQFLARRVMPALEELARENAELRGEIADLAHRVELDRKARGVGDGHELPPSLTQPKPRASARRKRPAASYAAGSAEAAP
jgi:hypothetical protein